MAANVFSKAEKLLAEQAAGRRAIIKFRIATTLWSLGHSSLPFEHCEGDYDAIITRAINGEFDPLPNEIAILLMEVTANEEAP